MPHAICTRCERVKRWSNYRGSRLADVRCGGCGGPVEQAMRVGRAIRAVRSAPGEEELIRQYVATFDTGPLVARRVLTSATTRCWGRGLDALTPRQAWEVSHGIANRLRFLVPDLEEQLT